MLEEIKKSYNPFKIWGSWVGLGIGVLAIILGVAEHNFMWFSFVMWTGVFIDPKNYDLGILIGLVAILTLPIVFFLYGWGINIIFDKLGRVGRSILLAVILTLFVINLAYIYTSGRQAFQAANPYYEYSIDTLLLNANNESLDINIRLTMLEVMIGKIEREGINLDEKKNLGNQLTNLSEQVNRSSQLSETDKERIALRIIRLQKLIEMK